jgi:terminase small subunit / prophage DNA-packing protein
MADLDQTCTQAAFGELVGMSQPAVSDLLAREVLRQGDTARTWLLAYCQHLRETAAGRDPDGQLAEQRARVAKETADKIAMANAVTRRELAPVGLLEVVLADVARQISTRLDAVVPQLRRRLPDLPASALNAIAAELAACRDLCASANIADADRLSRDGDDEDADPGQPE